MLNFDQIYINHGQKCEGGSVEVETFGNDKWDHCRNQTSKWLFSQMPRSLWNLVLKNIDICWLTCCASKYLKLLSDSLLTGPQKEDTSRTKRRTTSAFASHVWWYYHFVPKYMMKVKLIKYWMPNIMSEIIIHWENGDQGKHLTKIP